MEYMDGGSLGDLVHTLGPLPAAALSCITQQTLHALVELRECHLVHRDLKPQNILLSMRGECKLSDFGCVAELQDSFGKCGTFVGTVPYMSPERIQGEEYSYASDVWALGLTLVECAHAGRVRALPSEAQLAVVTLHQELHAVCVPAANVDGRDAEGWARGHLLFLVQKALVQHPWRDAATGWAERDHAAGASVSDASVSMIGGISAPDAARQVELNISRRCWR